VPKIADCSTRKRGQNRSTVFRCGNDCASSNGAPRAALRRQSDLKFEAAFPHFHPTATRL
jgi:hypothetical protein